MNRSLKYYNSSSSDVGHGIVDDVEPQSKKVKIELEIPPEELILRMSEVMHKVTN